MTREEIINGLKMTMELILFDPSTGETKEPHQLNDMDRTTYDACKGAIEALEKQEQTKEAIPHRNYQYLSDYWCECGWHLGKKGDVKFCADCGRRIKWD